MSKTLIQVIIYLDLNFFNDLWREQIVGIKALEH